MIQLVASLTVNPDEPEALRTYFDVAMGLIEDVGAKLSQKIEYGDPVIGDKPFEMVMLVDYPNYEAVRKVFHSEAYRAIIPERDKAFLKYNICLVQTNDLKM